MHLVCKVCENSVWVSARGMALMEAWGLGFDERGACYHTRTCVSLHCTSCHASGLQAMHAGGWACLECLDRSVDGRVDSIVDGMALWMA